MRKTQETKLSEIFTLYLAWDSHPEHIEELKRRSQEEPNKSAAQASWECFKTRMRKEYGEDFI